MQDILYESVAEVFGERLSQSLTSGIFLVFIKKHDMLLVLLEFAIYIQYINIYIYIILIFIFILRYIILYYIIYNPSVFNSHVCCYSSDL